MTAFHQPTLARSPGARQCPKLSLVQIVVVLGGCLLEDIAIAGRVACHNFALDAARMRHVVHNRVHHLHGRYWSEALLTGSLMVLAALITVPLFG